MKKKIKPLRVFVYGTLKKGYPNHLRAGKPDKIEPASVPGKLYTGQAGGIPVVIVPKKAILETGTRNYIRDAARTYKVPEGRPVQNKDDRVIIGEIFTYYDPVNALAALDGLEGFRPDSVYSSLYARVIVRTTAGVPVWIYVNPPGERSPYFARYLCGRPGKNVTWPEDSYGNCFSVIEPETPEDDWDAEDGQGDLCVEDDPEDYDLDYRALEDERDDAEFFNNHDFIS